MLVEAIVEPEVVNVAGRSVVGMVVVMAEGFGTVTVIARVLSADAEALIPDVSGKVLKIAESDETMPDADATAAMTIDSRNIGAAGGQTRDPRR